MDIDDNNIYQLREIWLVQAVAFLHEYMAECGLSPVEVRVSCGWPSRGGLARRMVLGQCFPPQICEDGRPQIFINPRMADSVEVMGILLHELIHAAVGCHHGHRKLFSQAAKKVGLVGPPTATRIGDTLRRMLERYVQTTGIYPHAAIMPKQVITGDAAPGQPEVQPEKGRPSSRLRLYHCACQPPVKVRVASDHFLALCKRCQASFHNASMDS